MTNWIFLNLFFFNIAFLFLVTSLRLCFSELYLAFLAWNSRDYTFCSSLLTSFLYSLFEMTASACFSFLGGHTLETRELFFFFMVYHFLILLLWLSSTFFLILAVPYGHLCFLLSPFSPVLHHLPPCILGNEIPGLWPISGYGNEMERGILEGEEGRGIKNSGTTVTR